MVPSFISLQPVEIDDLIDADSSQWNRFSQGVKIEANKLKISKICVHPKLTEAIVFAVYKNFFPNEAFKSNEELRQYWLYTVQTLLAIFQNVS